MIFEVDDVLKHIEFSIKKRVSRCEHKPKLAIISTVNDFASAKYVNAKINAAAKFGIETDHIIIENADTHKVIDAVHKTNADGIIVQLPVPRSVNMAKVNQVIDTKGEHCDVDGFSLINSYNLYAFGSAFHIPCTPQGIALVIHDFFHSKTAGKHVVIVNRSNIVGKPLAMLLMQREYNMTVTVCHSKTKNIDTLLKQADVIVTAVGKPKFIHAGNVSPNTLIVDVSINRDNTGKVVGDVDPILYDMPNIYCTKVPGGIGRLTVANLLDNTAAAALMNDTINEARKNV